MWIFDNRWTGNAHRSISFFAGWHSFLKLTPNPRRLVNPIVFFPMENMKTTSKTWPFLVDNQRLTMIFPHCSSLFHIFFKNMFPGFSKISRVISMFDAMATPEPRGTAPAFRLKEVYDLSRTTSALSKRVGDPSWMVYFDPKIRSGGTPTTGMKPPSIDR